LAALLCESSCLSSLNCIVAAKRNQSNVASGMMATEHSEDKKPGNGLEHGPAGDDFLNDKPTSYSDAEETAAIAAEEGHVATDKSVLVYTYHSARMDC
jgi:hypothetical protein